LTKLQEPDKILKKRHFKQVSIQLLMASELGKRKVTFDVKTVLGWAQFDLSISPNAKLHFSVSDKIVFECFKVLKCIYYLLLSMLVCILTSFTSVLLQII